MFPECVRRRTHRSSQRFECAQLKLVLAYSTDKRAVGTGGDWERGRCSTTSNPVTKGFQPWERAVSRRSLGPSWPQLSSTPSGPDPSLPANRAYRMLSSWDVPVPLEATRIHDNPVLPKCTLTACRICEQVKPGIDTVRSFRHCLTLPLISSLDRRYPGVSTVEHML